MEELAIGMFESVAGVDEEEEPFEGGAAMTQVGETEGLGLVDAFFFSEGEAIAGQVYYY